MAIKKEMKFKDTCPECGLVIPGFSDYHVKFNMSQHLEKHERSRLMKKFKTEKLGKKQAKGNVLKC